MSDFWEWDTGSLQRCEWEDEVFLLRADGKAVLLQTDKAVYTLECVCASYNSPVLPGTYH